MLIGWKYSTFGVRPLIGKVLELVYRERENGKQVIFHASNQFLKKALMIVHFIQHERDIQFIRTKNVNIESLKLFEYLILYLLHVFEVMSKI